jgi:hypothetical protein
MAPPPIKVLIVTGSSFAIRAVARSALFSAQVYTRLRRAQAGQ